MTARRRRGREVRAQEANLASGRSAGVPSATSLFALILASCALLLGAGVTWWHSTPSPLHRTPKGLKPVVCKPDDDAHNYEQLLNYLQGSHALLQNVELDATNGVRGLKARQHIPAGHPVLSIPYHRTLSIATSSESLTAARVTQGWREVEDGDVQLDTLALLYEAYVRGSAAPGWLRAYMCMLPQTYDLPVWWKDAWSGEVIAALPEMARLVTKRKAQVQQFEEMARKAVASMPGGRERFQRDAKAWDPNSFSRVFSWAYATAKTRTVTLDLTQKLGKEVRIPPRLSWLKEMGVLVPVLDLANHAPAATATAYFAVDMTKGSITQGQAPVFSLVASRDIQPGEQITFSYLPEDDDSPRCNERWLIEYGFVIADGRPERDCFTFNLTLTDVASVMVGASDLAAKTHHHPLPQTQAQWQEAMRQRTEQLGYPGEIRVQLGVGIAPETLTHDLTQLAAWAGAAAGLEKVEMSLACRALAAQRVRLQAQLHISQAVAGGGSGGHGGSGPTYQQQALLQVVEGAIRAVQRASAVVACTV